MAAKQHYDSNKEIYKQRARLQARKPKAFYRLLVKDAKERNLELTLSFEEFLRIRIGSACHYCGGDLPETGTGLDRKDSQLGYTPDNVVPCCWPCNNTKGHRLSYAEMLNLMAFRRENETAVRMISEC